METRLAHADQDVLQLRAATTSLNTEKELLTTASEDMAQKIRGFVRDIDGLLSDSMSRSHTATGRNEIYGCNVLKLRGIWLKEMRLDERYLMERERERWREIIVS